MKVLIDSQELQQSLMIHAKTIAKKHSIPILSSVLIKFTQSGIDVISTDLDSCCIHSIKGKISGRVYKPFPAHPVFRLTGEKNGNICIDFKALQNVTKKLSGLIQVEKREEKLFITEIESGFILEIDGQSSLDYPGINAELPKNFTLFSTRLLKICIEKTVQFASHDEGRTVFNGACLEFNDDNFKMIATDGYRLVIQEYTWQPFPTITGIEGLKTDNQLIIPRKPLLNILYTIEKLAKKEKKREVLPKIFIGHSENKFFCKIGEFLYFTRIIDGRFPNYKHVLLNTVTDTFQVDRADMIKKIEKLLPILDKKGCGLLIKSMEKEITLSGSNVNEEGRVTRGEISLKDAVTTGKEFKVMFNAHYILDFLNNLDNGIALINFNISGNGKQKSPIEIRDFVNEGLNQIVMPMQVDDDYNY